MYLDKELFSRKSELRRFSSNQFIIGWCNSVHDFTEFFSRLKTRILLNTVWKNGKFGLTEKIFRQINSLVICLVKPLFSRNFCRKSVRLKFHYFHTVHCGKTRNSLSSHWKFFSSNQLFSKSVIFTEFLLKMREREFPWFPHCAKEILKIPWNHFYADSASCFHGIFF